MSMSVGGVNVELNLNAKKFQQGLKQAQQQLKRFTRDFTKSFSVNIDKGALAPVVNRLDVMNGRLRSIQRTTRRATSGMSRGFDNTNKAIRTSTRSVDKLRKSLALARTESFRLGRVQLAAMQKGAGGVVYSEGMKGPVGSASSMDKLFSRDWLMQRATWFAQLRLFWSAFQSAQQALTSVVNLENELVNLRAITGATGEEMSTLEEAIRSAAVSTKFYASDVAAVATVLGQAGFKAREVGDIIGSVAVLASAVNREMKETGDVMTTVLKAWRLDSSQAGAVANTLAAGVSSARLQVEDMNTAFSYTATVFSQMGLSVEDAVAWLGVLRDVGVKASQAGTSLRRIYGALSKDEPTKRMARALKRVGLEWKDVSLHANTLNESLRKLKDSEISVIEVLGAAQTRTGSVLAAMIEQVDRQEELTEAVTGTNKAYEMNRIQLQSIQNQLKQTWSKTEDWFVAITDGGEGFIATLKIIQALLAGIGAAILGLKIALDALVQSVITSYDAVASGLIYLGRISVDILTLDFDGAKAQLKEAIEGMKAISSEGWSDMKEQAKRDWQAIQNLFASPPEGEKNKGKTFPGEGGLGPGPGEIQDVDDTAGKTPKSLSSVRRKPKFLSVSGIYKTEEEALRLQSEIARRRVEIIKERLGEVGELGEKSLEKMGLMQEIRYLQTLIPLKDDEIKAREKNGEHVWKEKLELENLVSELQLNIEQLENLQEQMDKTPWDKFVDGVRTANDEFTNLRSQMEEWGSSLTGTAQEGLTNTISAWLFPDEEKVRGVKDEMRSLNDELHDLKFKRSNIAQKGIIDADDAERIRELNREIQQTNDALEAQKRHFDDMSDPIKRAQNAIKEFADVVVGEIKKIVAKLIAMYIWEKMTGFFMGSASGMQTSQQMGTSSNPTGGMAHATWSRARGGILPNIKGFKKLATGGVTNGPTMALLGDNKFGAGKEIVIPADRIRSDSVSGYSRDSEESGDLNIINVVSPDTMLSTLQSKPGQNSVLNIINADVMRRGNTYRTIKGVR